MLVHPVQALTPPLVLALRLLFFLLALLAVHGTAGFTTLPLHVPLPEEAASPTINMGALAFTGLDSCGADAEAADLGGGGMYCSALFNVP